MMTWSRTLAILMVMAAMGLMIGMTGCIPQSTDPRTRILYAFWGSLEAQALDAEIVKAFEKENPDIKVTMLPIGARYSDKLQAMFVGGVAPDVMMIGLDSYPEWVEKGLIEPLDDLLSEDRKSEMMPVVRKAFNKEGHLYAIPIHAGGHVMFVNLDALDQAGVSREDLKTWAGIMKVAPRLSSRAGNPKALTEFAIMVPMPLTLIWSFGGTLFDDPTHPAKVTINSPQTAAGMELIRSIHRSGYAVPAEMLGNQGGYTLFRDGKVALYSNGRWVTPELLGSTRFRWDVVPVPEAEHGAVSRLYASGMGVWSGSRHKEASKRFVKFYTSKLGIDILLTGGRYTPVYRDWAFGDAFLQLRPPASMRVFSETLEAGKSEIPLYAAGSLEVDTLVRGRMEQLVSQPNLPVNIVMKGLEVDLDHWLKRRQRLGRMGGTEKVKTP